MTRAAPVISAIALLLLALAGASGCGGDGREGNGGPPPGPVKGAPDAGRILLENTTPYAIQVAYLNEVDPADGRVIRTEVAPGERSDVGLDELPGGWTVALDLVIVLADPEGNRVRRKANVTVDGDMVVRVGLKDPADPFSVEIETRTCGISASRCKKRRAPVAGPVAGQRDRRLGAGTSARGSTG